jgi:hypothetical protein
MTIYVVLKYRDEAEAHHAYDLLSQIVPNAYKMTTKDGKIYVCVSNEKNAEEVQKALIKWADSEEYPVPDTISIENRLVFEMELTNDELLEFERLFEDAESFTDYRLNEIGTEVKGFRDWNLEKRRRFVAFFFLKGLNEGWLLDEVGGL